MMDSNAPRPPVAQTPGSGPASPPGLPERAVDQTRKWINHHGALVVVACVALLGTSWMLLPKTQSKPDPPKFAYYLDPVTELLVTGPAAAIPPIDIGGKPAVRVHMFACGDCGDSFIAFYEKFSPEAKTRLEQIVQIMNEEGYFSELDYEAYELQLNGRMVSSDNVTWVLAESWDGRRVLRTVQREECPEGKYIACFPTEADP